MSVITPTHRPNWIRRAYESLLAQEPLPPGWEWEWVVVANGAMTPERVREITGCAVDPRVRVLPYTLDQELSPATTKRACCEAALGEIHVELDHDDELRPRCLRVLASEFEKRPLASMLFSDCTTMREDGALHVFNKSHGWSYRIIDSFAVPNAPPPLPQNLARAGFSPDHVRAWRAKAYRRAGGHLPNLAVCDDIDLVCRLFLQGAIINIPDFLYVYHLHETNTWIEQMSKIEAEMLNVYARWIEPLILSHCMGTGVPAVDLTDTTHQGWLSCPCDLTQRQIQLPISESSVGAMRSLRCPGPWFAEVHRCLTPGGMFLVQMPWEDVPKAMNTFKDLFHAVYVGTVGDQREVHFCALKEGYQPYGELTG